MSASVPVRSPCGHQFILDIIQLGCSPKPSRPPSLSLFSPPSPSSLPSFLPGLGMACSPEAGGPIRGCEARMRCSGSGSVQSERGADMQPVASSEPEHRGGNDT